MEHTPDEIMQRGTPADDPSGRLRLGSVTELYEELGGYFDARRAAVLDGAQDGMPRCGWTLRPMADKPGDGELVRTDSDVTRGDGWVNLATGAGGAGDRSQQSVFARPMDMAVTLAVALYYCDDLAAKVIEAHVDEALRMLPRVTAPEGVGEETRKAVQSRLEALGWVEATRQAAIFARALGDAWIFPVVDEDQSAPITRGARVQAFKNFDRRDLLPYRWDLNPLSPRYGEPRDYQIVAIWGDAQQAYVNRARLIHFEGVHVDVWERLANGGYNHSVLQRVLPVIRATQEAWDGVAYLLAEASLKVMSIKGLISKLATTRKLTLDRLALVNQTSVNQNMIAVDGTDETLARVEVGALAGLAATLETMMGRLASAAKMPVSILFGQAPGGLNAAVSGDVSTRAWYASVGAVQEHTLRRPMTRMVDLVAAELAPGTSGWGVEFPSLWDESPTERTDNRTKVVTALCALVTAAVLTPEEAAIELAQGDYAMDFHALGLEGRKALVEGKYEPAPEPGPTVKALPDAGPKGGARPPALTAPAPAATVGPKEGA